MEYAISYNENPYLIWYRTDCYIYGVTNQHPDGKVLNILIEGDDWEFQVNLNHLDSTSFTLPSDGVFDMTVTAMPLVDEEEVEVYSGILVELCQLQWCFLRLLQQLYCDECTDGVGLAGNLIQDACKKLCKEKKLVAGTGQENPGYTALRMAIVQLKSMLFVYMVHLYEYNLKYTGLEVPSDVRAMKIQVIKKLWVQILAFTDNCGFDCTEGASGATKNCDGCS